MASFTHIALAEPINRNIIATYHDLPDKVTAAPNTQITSLYGKTFNNVFDAQLRTIEQLHGQQVLSNIFVDTHKKSCYEKVVISDCRTVADLVPIIATFGHDNILLARIHRKDHPYHDFYREGYHVTNTHLMEVDSRDFNNDGTIEDIRKQIEEWCDERWKPKAK